MVMGVSLQVNYRYYVLRVSDDQAYLTGVYMLRRYAAEKLNHCLRVTV